MHPILLQGKAVRAEQTVRRAGRKVRKHWVLTRRLRWHWGSLYAFLDVLTIMNSDTGWLNPIWKLPSKSQSQSHCGSCCRHGPSWLKRMKFSTFNITLAMNIMPKQPLSCILRTSGPLSPNNTKIEHAGWSGKAHELHSGLSCLQ